MTLENSGYLWLLLVIPWYLFYSWLSCREASRLLYRFAHVRKSPFPRILSTLLLALALGAVILALSEPRVSYLKTVFNRSGIDVAIGIDVSKSMLAEDETIPEEGKKIFALPNRLNRARYGALTIIGELRGERTGVFIFASKGIALVPLTTDYGYCRYILKHVNDAAITIPGSDLSRAIETGATLFEESSRTSVKTMVLISDGEDISGDRSTLLEAAQRAAARGIAIFTVGVGTGRDVLIPVRNSEGTEVTDYYRDEDGSYLKTRLEEDTLRRIAEMTGGRYVRARDERTGEEIVDAILKRARTIEYTRTTEPAWYPLSPLLLGAALLFLAVSLLVRR